MDWQYKWFVNIHQPSHSACVYVSIKCNEDYAAGRYLEFNLITTVMLWHTLSYKCHEDTAYVCRYLGFNIQSEHNIVAGGYVMV
jgi:hypothetical protein